MTDSDQGLFDDPLPETPTLDEAVSYADQLVGEGKKFKDNEALARGKVEADAFIERLQKEGAMLRAELQKRETAEELFQRLTKAPEPKDTPREGDARPEVGSQNDGLKLDDVEQLLNKRLSEQQENDRRNQNKRIVRDELLKRYGPNWQRVLRDRQTELEVSEKYLTDLAQENPKVFLSLLGDAPKRDLGVTPPNSSVDFSKRSTSLPAGTKDWNYYENIRKTDFRRYMSPAIQNEMHEQHNKLGDSFFNR